MKMNLLFFLTSREGVTLEMLKDLCHPNDLLVENDYPHALEFEELLNKEDLSSTQQCRRCGKSYHLENEGIANPLGQEMCVFHPGRIVKEPGNPFELPHTHSI